MGIDHFPSAASTSSPGPCVHYMGYKSLRDSCSMVFRLCPAQQGPEAFRKSWCPSWPQEGLRLCTLILCEPLAVCSGPGIVLALHAGRCEMTEAGLRNRYFWEFCIPVLSYTMSKNNSIISLDFPVLICRRKEHAVKQVLMQRHNLRNDKGPVCTVLGCWYGCGLSWLLLKVYDPRLPSLWQSNLATQS